MDATGGRSKHGKPIGLTLATAKWPIPSARVRELMRQGAERALLAPPEWLAEIDRASLDPDTLKPLADDPVLVAAVKRANRASLAHWATANIQNPCEPVSAYITSDMLSNATELVRRGVGDIVLSSSRTAQNAAWQRWMDIAFELTCEPRELRELLDISARSIGDFINVNLQGITAFMREQSSDQRADTHADRRALVASIIEGKTVSAHRVAQRLDYELDRPHHAAIVWSEVPESALSQLEAAAVALSESALAKASLAVLVNASTIWVWVGGAHPVDLASLRRKLERRPGVRMALGTGTSGIEGFRQSHLDALSTQRVIGRLKSNAAVVHFSDIGLVSLMTEDANAVQRFISSTLGDLATASPVLRRSLLTFLDLGCNAAKAADALFVHRNTLVRRLDRAQELLPTPLNRNATHVAAALEVLRWTAHEDIS